MMSADKEEEPVEKNSIQRNWKKLCVVIFLISIFTTVTINISEEDQDFTIDQDNDGHVVYFKRSLSNCIDSNKHYCCLVNGSVYDSRCEGNCCRIRCTKVDTSLFNLSHSIEMLVQRGCDVDQIFLEIKDVKFANKTLSPNWMASENFQISNLDIDSIYLTNISPESFTGNIFKNLSYLVLQNLKVSHLHKGVFYGLKNLKYLFIYKSDIDSIDSGISYEINKNLEVLQIYESKLDLINLTGRAIFEKLYLADLRYNKFERIRGNSFIGLKFCQKIHLSSCSINIIEENAFANMVNLRLASISENNLTSLSENIFDININKFPRLELHVNPWDCNCELKWLQDYVFEEVSRNGEFRIPECAQPEQALFTEIDFCPVTSTGYSTDFPSLNNYTTPFDLTTDSTSNEASTTSIFETSTDSTSNEASTTSIFETSTEIITIEYTSISSSSTSVRSTPNNPTTESEQYFPTQPQTSSESFPDVTTPATSKATVSTTSEAQSKDSCQLYNLKINEYYYYDESSCTDDNIYILLPTTEFYAIEENGKLQINVSNSTGEGGIFWYNAKYSEENYTLEAHCKLGIDNLPYELDLILGDLYQICLINDFGAPNLSPFDCQIYRIPFGIQLTWIENNKKSLIIGLLCLYLLIIWITGGIIIFVVLLKDPSLLKGSKTVEIAKPRVDKKKNSKTSTDKLVDVPKLENVQETRLNRSLSEASITSFRSKISYMSAYESMSRQVIHWKQNERLKEEKLVQIYDEPPVLPPRNNVPKI